MKPVLSFRRYSSHMTAFPRPFLFTEVMRSFKTSSVGISTSDPESVEAEMSGTSSPKEVSIPNTMLDIVRVEGARVATECFLSQESMVDYSDFEENVTERNREFMEIGGDLLSVVAQLHHFGADRS